MPDTTPIQTPLNIENVSELELIEQMFFAYRDFIADADRELASLEFGRAHHRVLYFVNRGPGMTVANLLDTLQITKQSLARVLKQLIESGHITQLSGPRDRRQRLLYPTRKGRALIVSLSASQSRRINRALELAGSENRAIVTRFLSGMKD